MKFIQALHAALALGLFQQADAQNAVTVNIGQSGSNVFMEYSGSLAILPISKPNGSSAGPPGFYSGVGYTVVTAATNFDCYRGGDLSFANFLPMTNTSGIFFAPSSATGGTGVVANQKENYICVSSNYMPGHLMSGCLIFNGKTFSDMDILDAKTSTTTWNIGGAEGTQSITFVTNQSATASICVLPPVAPPVSAPVASSIPVAPPVASSAPVIPPTTGGVTSIISIIIGAILSVIGSIAAVACCIW